MKIALQDNNQFVLRFDTGEDILEGLAKFMSEQKVSACSFTGIGSTNSVELGFYNIHLKEFRKKPYLEEMEVLNFSGTGGIKDGQPIIHAHGMFGRNDFTVMGGHIFKMAVSATCEVVLTKLSGSVERKLNPDFNLNTLV